MRKMMSAGIMALVALCSLVLTSCLDTKDTQVQPTVPVAYVSLYNASPDAPSLNIRVDNNLITSRPFGYSDYTGYLRFYTGERRLQFGPFDASNIVVDTTLNLADSMAYSIFVVDQYSKASVLVLKDTGTAAVAGKAKVRFVNLSPDAGDLQLAVKDSTSIGEAEAFKQATAFKDVTAKTYALTVSGSGITSLDLPSVALADGKYYTVLVRGYKTPPAGNTHVLSAEVIQN